MKKTISRYLLDIWYKDHFIGTALLPFGFLFADFVKFRRWLYKKGIKKSKSLAVPVIVVGNVTVGGTGKTPLCIYLAHLLQSEGYRVGIISRGYGGKDKVQQVSSHSLVTDVGDETLLMNRLIKCPIVVGVKRIEAGEFLLRYNPCDVILSDDGLQHYALKRDIEIAVIDGDRRFGNSICLPAGPLREPIERLNTVDLVVVNGDKADNTLWKEWQMRLVGDTAVNLLTGENKPLGDFTSLKCHAVAGIGYPDRFFNQLKKVGILQRTDHSFPDHHIFTQDDIIFDDDPVVLMTEKDAIKCQAFATKNHWVVPVTANLPIEFDATFLALLKTKILK